MSYTPVIGIEIHIQLNTKTKLFCSCLNEYIPDEPNKNICEFCTGQPGALPVLNKMAVKKAIKFGVAVGANIPNKTRWDRKNYFYPDLPAGYQISQYDNPIVEGGSISFFVENKDGKVEEKTINLTRAHLEADAGKLLHIGDHSYADYNRSGCPLIEIVSEPEIQNSAQAMAYVAEMQLLVRSLGVSDADLEKGQMRFDCNISLQNETEKAANKLPNYKVEVKNINSIRAIGRAVEFEIVRQTALLENGEMPAQETRGWRDDENKSVSQRSKEQAHDYRYFPEPDLQILVINPSDIPTIESLGELPMVKRKNYINNGLNLQIANTFLTQPVVGELFDLATNHATSQPDFKQGGNFYKTAANLITGSLLGLAIKSDIEIGNILTNQQIYDLVNLLDEKKINNLGLQKILEILNGNSDLKVLETAMENSLIQLSDDGSLQNFVDTVIQNNPAVIEQYKSGKVQVIGFLIGDCMKESKGQGNPEKFKTLLESSLSL